MHRRSLLTGLVTALAAPAIVRAQSIMPLWVPKRELVFDGVDDVLTMGDFYERVLFPTVVRWGWATGPELALSDGPPILKKVLSAMREDLVPFDKAWAA